MIDFEYYNPAKIVFGEHSEGKLRELLAAYGVKSLLRELLAAYGVKSLQLVYSGDFIKTLGIYDVIKDAVAELGIRFSENGNVVPNHSVRKTRRILQEVAPRNDPDRTQNWRQ